MKILEHRFCIQILRFAFASVFVYAGVLKLGSPQNFADSIATFAIIPSHYINFVAISLPPFEILAGLAAMAGIQRRSAILGLTATTFVFILALGAAIIRGIPVDCGCFGSGKSSASAAWIALGRDFILFAVGLLLYRSELSKIGLPPEIKRDDDIQSNVAEKKQ